MRISWRRAVWCFVEVFQPFKAKRVDGMSSSSMGVLPVDLRQLALRLNKVPFPIPPGRAPGT